MKVIHNAVVAVVGAWHIGSCRCIGLAFRAAQNHSQQGEEGKMRSLQILDQEIENEAKEAKRLRGVKSSIDYKLKTIIERLNKLQDERNQITGGLEGCKEGKKMNSQQIPVETVK